MRGKHNGVQKHILDINPRAFYVPCNSHSLNLDDINLTGTHGLQTKADAYALLKNICDFKFLCSIIIWYDILSIVNPVSKQLQSIQFDIQIYVKSISEVIEFLKEYRKNGFFKVKLTAKEIASVIGILEGFPQDHQVRKRFKKTNFNYENKDDSPLHNPEKKFEVDFFNTHCKDLGILLSSNDTSDIDVFELFEEIKLFCQLAESNSSPMTVASAERSFSKLKLVKNHLRSIMSNERLTGLSILSIEAELAQELNLEYLIQDFATKKARKVNLQF
ncbi:uncharacterized protein LOC112592885 [Melanaphis sacchari]|uniref:uncharacterized protein LOC112592885 n=1 Tax=Melanaphis sacchari TaxID=742174 RepID=UPI000DC152AA|nr:uncharacterized protein LOC112592885 [Melanaphis sacchari]